MIDSIVKGVKEEMKQNNVPEDLKQLLALYKRDRARVEPYI